VFNVWSSNFPILYHLVSLFSYELCIFLRSHIRGHIFSYARTLFFPLTVYIYVL